MVDQNFKNKKLIVITGPSGAGKTSIAEYLNQKYQIPKMVTHTTRAPRANEKDGTDYYFETDDSFQKLHLLEFVNYAGSKYGSSLEAVDRIFQEHPIASVVIDTVGAVTYQQKLPDLVAIVFVTVSTPEILSQRLFDRGDNPQEIKERITSDVFLRDTKIPQEIKQVAHIINNDDWDQAQRQLDKLIQSLSGTDL